MIGVDKDIDRYESNTVSKLGWKPGHASNIILMETDLHWAAILQSTVLIKNVLKQRPHHHHQLSFLITTNLEIITSYISCAIYRTIYLSSQIS